MMMTPEDAAALFDLPPPPETAPAAESSMEAAEAALAAEIVAELESTLGSGGVAADAPDSRTNQRVNVSWPARLQLPDGRVLELEVRNISTCGVGLKSEEPIPADTVVTFQMAVPPVDGIGTIRPVKGKIKTTYTVVQGTSILCGATWQAPPAGLDLVNAWINRTPTHHPW